MKEWAKNAVEAYLMEENEKYKMIIGPDGRKIVPIDNENTGVINYNTHLSHGLHQFLELKHNCPFSPINVISSYQMLDFLNYIFIIIKTIIFMV